ncbi:hypothetical protein PEDI_47240 [Persicobacter diffluens]|uniref:Uncharacterized protein n=1 Tax=Persicobacter diffluens TaxID=981 RepID=A0AAN4W4K4_9BACT|nr:hypothetical protein PEDI_47240 [Persicobacter diffluens]
MKTYASKFRLSQINYTMAMEYLSADGKTQALFGFTNLKRFYYPLIGFSGLIIGIISTIREKEQNRSLPSILLAVVSIILTFLDIWKVFI